MNGAALRVDSLRVELATGGAIVEDVSLSVEPGEVLGLVGESGCGKTTTALAMLGFERPGARITAGRITVAGMMLDAQDRAAVKELRGRLVSYVPQDPGNSLNPALRIRDAIQDMIAEHQGAQTRQASLEDVLSSVNLPASDSFTSRFPHQLSGGQQQRVMIAMALVCEPPVVVLDEPTTGLDVITQAQVLGEIRRLSREQGLAMVFVTHNLAVVSDLADQIGVMYCGRIVEQGPTRDVLTDPKHPYTAGLVASIPEPGVRRRLEGIPGLAPAAGDRPAGCTFAPRCRRRSLDRAFHEEPVLEDIGGGRQVRCFEWRSERPLPAAAPVDVPEERNREGAPLLLVEHVRAEYGRRGQATVAVEDVSFAVSAGACVAIVGESGSGKSTVSRCIAGLHVPSAGRIVLDGVPLHGLASRRPLETRRRIQIVFQNAYDSLNPRHRVVDSIARPLRVLRSMGRTEAEREVSSLLERVAMPASVASRFPAELSGGERQRVAIARALAAEPDLLICDEITSALDVSVQAAVLNLLGQLRRDLGLSMLFVSHDLGVVSQVADEVLVLQGGVMQEYGRVDDVVARPQHEYTRRLLAAAPRVLAVPLS